MKAARLAEQQAQARASYLEDLSHRTVESWQRVEQLIDSRQPNAYQEAVRLLIALRDLGARQERTAEFAAQLGRLRAVHSRRPTLLRRMAEAGLGGSAR